MTLNIASILLGLAALLIPFGRRPGRCILSFALCLTALLCQFFEIARRVALGDLAAVADTARAVCIAAAALSLLCIAVNLVCAKKQDRRRP